MSNEPVASTPAHAVAMSELFIVLKSLVGFSVAELVHRGDQVRILARVPGENGKRWLDVVRSLKAESLRRRDVWSLDSSKDYFFVGDDPDGDFRYAWRLIVKSSNLGQAFVEMKAVAKNHIGKKRTGQLMEVPLPGATASRNRGKHGGGARLTSGSKESMPALELFRR